MPLPFPSGLPRRAQPSVLSMALFKSSIALETLPFWSCFMAFARWLPNAFWFPAVVTEPGGNAAMIALAAAIWDSVNVSAVVATKETVANGT